MLTSGAHVSRYIVQSVVQHVTRKGVHFIKGPWARSLPFSVFAHFLHTASKLYPNLDLAKGEDDGTLFLRWVADHKSLHPHGKPVPWDKVVDMFENGFMPFCPKVVSHAPAFACSLHSQDPVHVQLPVAVALEPRLLPLAQANGLGIHKVRQLAAHLPRRQLTRPSTATSSSARSSRSSRKSATAARRKSSTRSAN